MYNNKLQCKGVKLLNLNLSSNSKKSDTSLSIDDRIEENLNKLSINVSQRKYRKTPQCYSIREITASIVAIKLEEELRSNKDLNEREKEILVGVVERDLSANISNLTPNFDFNIDKFLQKTREAVSHDLNNNYKAGVVFDYGFGVQLFVYKVSDVRYFNVNSPLHVSDLDPKYEEICKAKNKVKKDFLLLTTDTD